MCYATYMYSTACLNISNWTACCYIQCVIYNVISGRWVRNISHYRRGVAIRVIVIRRVFCVAVYGEVFWARK